MFGLSWEQIILILLAALFLLGPERIPGAVQWVMESLRKVRGMASGAQSEMQSHFGPELEELRRQIAELQSLKEINELRSLRELDPRRMIGKNLLGNEFSGGMTGFLGLNEAKSGAAGEQGAAAGSEATGTAAQGSTGRTVSTGTAGNGASGAGGATGAVNGSDAKASPDATGGSGTGDTPKTAAPTTSTGTVTPRFDDEGT